MERRRLKISTKSFEEFNYDYSDLSNIPDIKEQNGYLPALPAALEIMGYDGMYKVEAIEHLDSHGCVFHVVTNQEDFEYMFYLFLNTDRFAIPDEIKVLVLYFDKELGVSTALALKVRLEKLGCGFCVPNASGEGSQNVVQFNDFNYQVFSRHYYDNFIRKHRV